LERELDRQAESQIAAVVLAAGASKRMGELKQRLPFARGSGESMLRHAASSALATGCRPVFVVLGAEAESLRSELDELDVEVVENEGWAEGMASSIRAAVAAAERIAPSCTALLVTLADQPLVGRAELDRLLTAFRAGDGAPAASEYGGGIGAPAVIPRRLFAALAGLRGDRGARSVLAGEPVCGVALECAARDIDTPEDYRQLVAGEQA